MLSDKLLLSAQPSPADIGPNLFVWGDNTYGQLGLGDTVKRSSPAQIAGTWAQIASLGGKFSLALGPQGTLWSWGRNAGGALGLGDTVSRSSPVQIPGTWDALPIGSASRNMGFAAAIKTDGSLWVWGQQHSQWGPLGLGDTMNRSSPVQVSGTWKAVSLSGYSMFGLKSDGTLWATGSDYHAALGLGTYRGHKSSFTQNTQSTTTWLSIVGGSGSGVGLRPNGTAWAWGHNNFGCFGLSGYLGNYTSPVQVPGTWLSFYPAETMSTMIRHDGTLWSAGANNNGGLGLGDTINRSSPVQVGTGAWVSAFTASNSGIYSASALKADGQAFAWGDGSNGALGVGDTIKRSSPVQIAGTWRSVKVGAHHSFGLKM